MLPVMVAENTGQKLRGRPFEPGRSGNPRGRPCGALNRATLLLDRMAHDDAADVLGAVLGRAKAGDMQAAGLILSRIWQPRKGRPVTLDLPPMQTAADLATALGVVTQAVARGELTPDEAQAVATLLEIQRKTIELVELEQRIAALEAEQDRGNAGH
jgi:polyhydroxyalkanoate synthesis regulator phasin